MYRMFVATSNLVATTNPVVEQIVLGGNAIAKGITTRPAKRDRTAQRSRKAVGRI